jgi:hypothetical protein
MLNDTFPPKSGDFSSTSFMVSVEESSALIYYHGVEAAYDKGSASTIWKFSFSNHIFEQIGQLQVNRNDFQVLPINGLSCP